MTKEQLKVKEFHDKFKCLTNTKPTLPSQEVMNLRVELINEELEEFAEACILGDLVKVADGLGDLLYVVYGAGLSFGIDLEPIFDEIHRSNMTKVRADGTVIRNEMGKIIKPETYSPANLRPILIDQLLDNKTAKVVE